jgi:hypothetical protein
MTSNEQSTPLQIPRKKTSTIVIFRSVSIYELGSIWSNSEVSTQQMNQIKNTQHKGNPKVKNIYIQDKPISSSRYKGIPMSPSQSGTKEIHPSWTMLLRTRMTFVP